MEYLLNGNLMTNEVDQLEPVNVAHALNYCLVQIHLYLAQNKIGLNRNDPIDFPMNDFSDPVEYLFTLMLDLCMEK